MTLLGLSPDAFGELTGPFQRELLVHCYRMLGSVDDAEDAVQEALARAWRGRATFQTSISVRAWLYRIATNCCFPSGSDSAGRGSASHAKRDPPAAPRDRTFSGTS